MVTLAYSLRCSHVILMLCEPQRLEASGSQYNSVTRAPHLPGTIHNAGVLLCGRGASGPARHQGLCATDTSAPP